MPGSPEADHVFFKGGVSREVGKTREKGEEAEGAISWKSREGYLHPDPSEVLWNVSYPTGLSQPENRGFGPHDPNTLGTGQGPTSGNISFLLFPHMVRQRKLPVAKGRPLKRSRRC